MRDYLVAPGKVVAPAKDGTRDSEPEGRTPIDLIELVDVFEQLPTGPTRNALGAALDAMVRRALVGPVQPVPA